MSDKKPSVEKPATPVQKYEPPVGKIQNLNWKDSKGKTHKIIAQAEWMTLRKHEKPVAEMFHTYYKLDSKSQKNRPLTFVFNGGPGAASAYLHIGGLGPQRVYFEPDGNLPPPPIQMKNNAESWMGFTDLVFIDPIGTGFSRIIESAKEDTKENKVDGKPIVEEKEFFQLNRDLDSLGEFIEKFLSRHKLWDRKIMIAGESYGGYRVAKLARRLQEGFGVGLHAAIAISPALEWSLLNPHDYDTLSFVDGFCTMALAAAFHGKSRVFKKGTSLALAKSQIEEFATNDFAISLVSGSHHSEKNLNIWKQAADYLGLDPELLVRSQGRVRFWRFAREIFKAESKIIGFYDASIVAVDPYPDRELHQAPDPTLVSIERIFASGINHLLRSVIGVSTERRYELLSTQVNMAWRRDEQQHIFDTNVGATDDLRFAMSMNPHMKVLITHGLYDMVTPYMSSDRLASQMRLLPEQEKMLHIKHFGGGHMFYTWEKSRVEFTRWVEKICQ